MNTSPLLEHPGDAIAEKRRRDEQRNRRQSEIVPERLPPHDRKSESEGQ